MIHKVMDWFHKSVRVSSSATRTGASTKIVEIVEPVALLPHVEHGTISVSNNQVYVTNPEGEGSYPTLTVPNLSCLDVFVDGVKRVGRVIVHEDQDIQVAIHDVAPTRKFSLKASADAMEVIARTEVIPGESYRLVDATSVRHTVLALETRMIAPAPLEVRDVEVQLHSDGYHGDVDDVRLKLLCNARKTQEAVILRGVPATPGKTPRYMPVKLPKVYDPVHRRMRISSISMGSTVAVLDRGLPSVPGRDVFGNEVSETVRTRMPKLGQGVVEVNERLVAVRNGRLLFTDTLIDVIPELVVYRDLSSKDGKVEFDGNVVVWGSVLDGSFIKATGTVEVHGRVLCSTIMGERGVYVTDSMIGSRAISGHSKILYTPVQSIVKECLAALQRFHREYVEFVAHSKSRFDRRTYLPLMADVLLKKRHTNLENLLDRLATDPDGVSDVDDRYRQIAVEIRAKWSGIQRTNIFDKDIVFLLQLVEEYNGYVETMMTAEPAPISVASVTSSSLRATGRIVVTGIGVYASSLQANDSIVARGTVRGGFLVAEKSIRIGELGTPAGIESSVKVCNPAGKIGIKTRHPNTLLQVGNQRSRNQVTEYRTLLKGDTYANSYAYRG